MTTPSPDYDFSCSSNTASSDSPLIFISTPHQSLSAHVLCTPPNPVVQDPQDVLHIPRKGLQLPRELRAGGLTGNLSGGGFPILLPEREEPETPPSLSTATTTFPAGQRRNQRAENQAGGYFFASAKEQHLVQHALIRLRNLPARNSVWTELETLPRGKWEKCRLAAVEWIWTVELF